MSTLKIDIDTSGFLDKNGKITAPVQKGQKLGTYTLSLSGEKLCSVDLVARDNISLNETAYNIEKAKAFIGSFWFKLAAAIAISLVIFYIIIYLITAKKRRRKIKRVRKKRKF